MQSKWKKLFAVRLDEDDLEWLRKHKDPAEYLRTLIKKARFPEKAKELEEKEEKEKEEFKPECPFGTYLSDIDKVFCRCHFKAVRRWLPKNQQIKPEVCQDCWITTAKPTLEFAEREREKRLGQFESLSGSKENPENLERKEFEEKWKNLFKNEFYYDKESQMLIRKKKGLRL